MKRIYSIRCAETFSGFLYTFASRTAPIRAELTFFSTRTPPPRFASRESCRRGDLRARLVRRGRGYAAFRLFRSDTEQTSSPPRRYGGACLLERLRHRLTKSASLRMYYIKGPDRMHEPCRLKLLVWVDLVTRLGRAVGQTERLRQYGASIKLPGTLAALAPELGQYMAMDCSSSTNFLKAYDEATVYGKLGTSDAAVALVPAAAASAASAPAAGAKRRADDVSASLDRGSSASRVQPAAGSKQPTAKASARNQASAKKAKAHGLAPAVEECEDCKDANRAMSILRRDLAT